MVGNWFWITINCPCNPSREDEWDPRCRMPVSLYSNCCSCLCTHLPLSSTLLPLAPIPPVTSITLSWPLMWIMYITTIEDLLLQMTKTYTHWILHLPLQIIKPASLQFIRFASKSSYQCVSVLIYTARHHYHKSSCQLHIQHLTANLLINVLPLIHPDAHLNSPTGPLCTLHQFQVVPDVKLQVAPDGMLQVTLSDQLCSSGIGRMKG